MRASFRLVFSLAVLSLLSLTAAAQSSDFTIIALPDTQNEAQFFPGVLASQTEWIVDHRDDLNIQMVLGEGDIVNDFSSPAQEQSADAAFRVLDRAGIPYLLAIGNHDYDDAAPKNGRPVTGFNRFFGPSRYAGRAYYRGNFPSGSNENFFGVLNIGGKDFLFLILEFMPRHESVEWAESVLQANPDKQVIVVTHSYMYVDDTRVDSCDTTDMPPGNGTGDDLWQELRRFPNVIMVLSGHLTNGQAAHRADIGDNGNLVNEIFANYQTFPHGGDGWLRIITFHPAKNSISVQTYSPFLNRFKTDKRNQFTVFYHNPHLVTGSGELSGMVRSASDCEPISGATVSTDGASTTTGEDGRYSLRLSPGSHQLSVSVPGWTSDAKSETVFDGFDTDLNFFLTQTGQPGSPAPGERLSMNISPSQATITLGHSAQFVVQIGTDGSLKDPVNFSCSGLPPGATCAFDPANMNPANLPATSKLTIFTNGVTAASIPRGMRGLIWVSILLPGVVLLGCKRRGHAVVFLFGALVLLGAGWLAGCHGVASPANKGSFTITVTSSSGSVQKSSNISLTLE